MNAILLSAGFGTRFLPYTKKIAKPAIPFMGLPLICYSLFYAQKWGVQKTVINTHHLPASIADAINKYKKFFTTDIQFLNESPVILDSGGGIKNAQQLLNNDDNFLVFNTDIPHMFSKIDFQKILADHKERGSLATLITCDLENLGNKISGVWTMPNDLEIKDFGLGPKSNYRCRHYTGFMIVSREIFKYQPLGQPHNILYDVILPCIQSKKERAYCHHLTDLNWFETGNLESYLQASFTTLDILLNSPDSDLSQELKKIFDFYKINYFMHSDELRKIFSNSPIDKDKLNLLSGFIINFSNEFERFRHPMHNCVIGNLPTTNSHSRLINTFLL